MNTILASGIYYKCVWKMKFQITENTTLVDFTSSYRKVFKTYFVFKRYLSLERREDSKDGKSPNVHGWRPRWRNQKVRGLILSSHHCFLNNRIRSYNDICEYSGQRSSPTDGWLARNKSDYSHPRLASLHHHIVAQPSCHGRPVQVSIFTGTLFKMSIYSCRY